MLKNTFLILLLLTFSISYAQKEANIWYFGEKAGLDFNSGEPVALTNGELETIEGCSTISDSAGNLLFYSDGRKVWNRNHEIMPNGHVLFGHYSSTQSAIIVPSISYSNIYYIFTVDEKGGPKGLNYSKVDMSLESGLGDVDPTEKNISLLSPVSEKITANKSDNSNSIYVYTYRAGKFYTFEINESGVNTTPIHIAHGFFEEDETGRGYLKASPDGETLAIAHEADKKVFIFDVNKVTGVISNEREMFLDDPTSIDNSTDTLPYGIEFSPDSSLLYVSSANEAQSNEASNKSYVWQFDLTDANPAHTAILIHYKLGRGRGALQLASDLKIYHANAIGYHTGFGKLNVIEKPNLRGDGDVCLYRFNHIDLGGKLSKQGLPPFIQSFFNVFIVADDTCHGFETEMDLVDYDGVLSYKWDFGDGSALETGSFSPTTHLYADPGLYKIEVIAQTTAGTKHHFRFINILVPKADELPDISVCDKYILPTLSSSSVNFYTESEGNGEQLKANDEIMESQLIYIYTKLGTSPNFCTDETSFYVTIENTPELNGFDDIVAKNEYVLPMLVQGKYYTESGGKGEQLFAGDIVKRSQTIYVYVEIGEEPNICFNEISFEVTIEIEIEYMPFFTPNGNGENDYWKIEGNQLMPNTKISIFDRFGKLVALINPDIGWDGTTHGIKQASSDYWFSLQLNDGTYTTGNFSLIRK
jgi:gliding motility-associated-like protein